MTDYFTRDDYMAASGPETHRKYYAQFVTPAVKTFVAVQIGVGRIKASTDPHMNDIPLELWDRLHEQIRAHCVSLMRQIGGTGGYSLSDSVCIAKEAAKQIKEAS